MLIRLIRNFLIITIAIVVLAVILRKSDTARKVVLPQGFVAPPGTVNDTEKNEE